MLQRKKLKKLISLILTLMLVLQIMPTFASAAELQDNIIATGDQESEAVDAQAQDEQKQVDPIQRDQSSQEQADSALEDEDESEVSTDSKEEETASGEDSDAANTVTNPTINSDESEDDSETEENDDETETNNVTKADITTFNGPTTREAVDYTWMYINTEYTYNGSSDVITFKAFVNKIRENLDASSLTTSLTGDYSSVGISVYIVNEDGTTQLLTEGTDYEINGDTITFYDPDQCYLVEYSVAANDSFTNSSMDPAGNAVTIDGQFSWSYALEGAATGSTMTIDRSFQPLTYETGNENLNNYSILTDADAEAQKSGSGNDYVITIEYEWSLDGLLDSLGNTIDLTVNAGDYFIFQIDTTNIDLYNDVSGDICLPLSEGGIKVGDFYLDCETGKVIIVFNQAIEDVANRLGTFTVNSSYSSTSGSLAEIEVTTNGDTVVLQPIDKEITLKASKSAAWEDDDTIVWSVYVNSEKSTVNNLTVTDASGSGWTFDGGIEVYKYESGSWVPVNSSEYSTTFNNGNWEIVFPGETSDYYKIDLTADTTSTDLGLSYRNTVYAESDEVAQLNASTTITRSAASVSKSGTFDPSTSTATWVVRYNTGNKELAIADIELEDYPYAYWNTGGSIDITNLVIDEVKLGSTVLATDDYDIQIYYDSSGTIIEGFVITLKSGGTHNLTGTTTEVLSVEYTVDLDLSNPPSGAKYWSFSNSIDDGNSGGTTGTITKYNIVKGNASSINYNTKEMIWQLTINASGVDMQEGTKVYDVLPTGLTMAATTDSSGSTVIDTSKFGVYNITQGATVPVVYDDGSLNITLLKANYPEGFFVYSDQAVSGAVIDSSGGTIDFANGEGYTLTFYPGTTHQGTDSYRITYYTHFDYDPYDDSTASRIGTNKAYLVYLLSNGNEAYTNDTGTYTLSNAANGSKSGSFNQATTDVDEDGNVKSNDSTITWTIQANLLNQDISGATFTDVLQYGKIYDESGNLVTDSTLIQKLEASDVHVYPITTTNTLGTTFAIDYTNEILPGNGITITVEDVSADDTYDGDYALKIEFDNDYADTHDNMRFAVVITTTLEGGLAYQYDNTAQLDRGNQTPDSWSADVTVDAVENPAEKTGTVNSSSDLTISYKAILNKDQKKISNMEVTDSLCYTDEGEQILYLIESSLVVYEATIEYDNNGNLVYGVGKVLTPYDENNPDDAWDYKLVYDQNAQDGFTLVFNESYVLDGVPLGLEYECAYNHIESGTTVTNKISIKGYDNEESEAPIVVKYTTASGGSSGSTVSFSVKKVDEEGNALTGANFVLLNRTKIYIVSSGEVDANGVLQFNDVIEGIYYLQEKVAPDGYQTDYGTVNTALKIQVVKDGDDVKIKVDGQEDATNQLEIENGVYYGSLSLTKYAYDIDGEKTNVTLQDAKFQLYKEDDNGTKLYYYGTDANGIAAFSKEETPLILTTDGNGVLEVQNIPVGTYYVEEIESPVGYLLLEQPQKFEIPSANEAVVVGLYDQVETIEAKVEKTWDDGNDQDGVRPENIKVQLYADGAKYGDAVTLDAANNWSYTWSGLQKYDSDHLIEYTVEEVEVPKGYEVSYSDDTFTITNTHIPETTERTVEKQWNDSDNQDGSRPNSIKVQLKGNGSNYGEEITLSEENNWTYKWSDLPKYANKEEIIYTVVEVETPAEYAVSYSEENGAFIITNSYTTKEVSKTVSKNWVDHNNQDGIRTEQIEVQLYADDAKYGTVVTLDASNNWAYTWNNLPQYQSGKEITYTVKEITVPDGYEVSYSDDTFTITNTHTPAVTERTVTKKWADNENQDGIRPESIQVQLYADGEKNGDVVTLDAANNWSYTWSSLPEYKSGETIRYTVQEITVVDSYEVSYSEDTFTITNTHTPAETERTAIKKWDDNEDQDGIRPESIQVQLYADGEKNGDAVTLDASNSWSYTWNSLPKYQSGELIEYTVEETEVPEGYEVSYSEDTFTITNIHRPEATERTVIKQWDDSDNQDGSRPDSVTVQLKSNGSNYDEEITLSQENNWSYTWSDLPKYENKEEITYSVVEVAAPAEYAVNYSEEEGTFTITNSYTPGEVSKTVSKNWDDSSNQDGIRTEQIEVQLYADGEKNGDVVTLDDSNNWSYTWNNLPEYQSGEVIEYTVEEVEVPDGYTVSYSEDTFTITNSHTPSTTARTVIKKWADKNDQDGTRPDSIQVQLYADAEKYGDVVTLKASNNWTYTWDDLPEYQSGEEITYTVKETSVPNGYKVSYSKDTFTITNTHTPGTTTSSKTTSGTTTSPKTTTSSTKTTSATKTDDANHLKMVLWLMVLACSGLIVFVGVRYKKRKNWH